MESQEKQIIIEHHRLFNAGPRTQSLSFVSDKVRSDLLGFCQIIKEKIGQGKELIVYPHRILQQGMWSIQLIGDTDKVYLLLSIAGRFKLTLLANGEPWPVRWQIDIADHIDAYWFIELLAQELNLAHTRIHLSTDDVDSAVVNIGENNDGASKINP
ncbi:hypothetical protein FW755_09400 [Lonepinella koalarum]|uniref:hypothetical protein n=1 Tax=Lonepinella koalarum TaxID=53417 RepID=UPI0011E4B506|nr:hypothetical protein [Lonepinella koalarum]TYG35292.1 hypothetical protein FW755_09400 [Lonepinella koalarum]